MAIYLKPFLERLFPEWSRSEGSPLCYIEFGHNVSRGAYYSSRVVVYKLKAEGRVLRAYYSYVDDNNQPDGREIGGWSMNETSHMVMDILSIETSDRNRLVRLNSRLPLLQVMA